MPPLREATFAIGDIVQALSAKAQHGRCGTFTLCDTEDLKKTTVESRSRPQELVCVTTDVVGEDDEPASGSRFFEALIPPLIAIDAPTSPSNPPSPPPSPLT